MRRRTHPRIVPRSASLPLALFFATLLGAMPPESAATETVVVSFVGEAGSSAARGAALGLEEANRAARYFGFQFELDDAGNGDAVGPLVIVATQDGATLEALVEPGRLVINAKSPERRGCRDGLFHVAPSQTMLDSAATQWRDTRKGDAPSVESWHPSLVKFAARDLNKRYAARYGDPMRGDAWAAWAAARSVGEAVLRVRSADPVQIASYFEGEFGLDGQKGVALTFRPNRQLRQPLYYVDAEDRVVGEAPLRDAAVSRDLDSLDTTNCGPAVPASLNR